MPKLAPTGSFVALGLQALDDAVHDLGARSAAAMLEQQGELVAPHAEHGVVVADRAEQQVAERAQQAVALGVPVESLTALNPSRSQ